MIRVKLNSDTQFGQDGLKQAPLDSFNFAMEAQAADPEETSPEKPKQATEVVRSVNNQLNDIATELERLRDKQAKLVKELRQGQQTLDAQPREVFTTSYSSNDELDNYKESWRRHVETYGNKHYPRNISEQGLSGTLILAAIVRANGSLLRVDIMRSSGNQHIDAAAIAIVNAAAPYPKLSPETKSNTLVHIIRTWQFKHNSVESSEY